MLKTISSYYLPEQKKKCCNIIDYGDKKILKCNIFDEQKIIDELKNNNLIVKDNCHKTIFSYIDKNESIFNGKIKFCKKSLLSSNNVYLGIRAMYKNTILTIEIFLLNSLPIVMQNKEIFFNYSSLVKSNIENFDIKTISKKFGSIHSLGETFCELFNIVYDNMLNN